MNKLKYIKIIFEMLKMKKKIGIQYLLLSNILIITIFIMLFMDQNCLKPETISGNRLKNCSLIEDHVKEYELIFGDNITGYPYEIVPNIVHYVLFTIHEIQFGHFVSILSVLRNQKPDKIIIHCDCDQLNGNYYKRIVNIMQSTKSNTRLIIRRIEKPTQIFGKPLNWINWHASDITRIRVLLEFGGIYLDQDVYVVKSLNKFRKYEMTLNWDENQYLGNQVLIGHKNSRFLKLYLESYHNYDPNQWYYNGGELPTTSILYKNPELVHRVKREFGVDGPQVCPKVYRIYYPDWQKDFYTIHLVLRGNEIVLKAWCFNGNEPPVMKFDEEIAKNLSVTFGEMTRLLFDS